MKILILLLLLSFDCYSMLLPQNKFEFCSRYDQNNPHVTKIQELASDSQNLMAFKNNGGLFNQGVCWWHSRFQRNVLYLGIFRPDLPSPSQQKIKEIIFKIRQGLSVVEIPGFNNFHEFSIANQNLIQQELNQWQLYDGIILGKWIDGLKGESQTTSQNLHIIMNTLYQYVENQEKIAYQKLQIKGITSHAWLIIGMKKNHNGFDLGYIDSNMPRMSLNYSYVEGDKSFYIKGYGDFVPYLEFVREENRISNIAKSFCGKQSFMTFSRKQYEEDYRLDLNEALTQH